MVVDRSGNIGQYVTNKLNDKGVCPYCESNIDGVWK